MREIIDHTTGEIIEADDAWERHKRIVGLRNQLEENFLRLGEELHWFHTLEQYKTQQATFEAYLADPDVDIGRRTAFRLMAVYRHYTLTLECAPGALLQVGAKKAELLIPHTTKRNVEEWLIKAASLSRSDLRIEIGDIPHVSRNSGNNEWYTPPKFIKAARQVMGTIDLDPASSEIANKIVQATKFYTEEQDGLLYTWKGRVWMNPPYAANLIGLFANKLAQHVKWGDVPEACVLVNNATETGWFNVMLDVASCVCFIRSRVKFIDTEGKPSGAPLQGQALLYFGPSVEIFRSTFSEFGTILYARRDSEQEQSTTA